MDSELVLSCVMPYIKDIADLNSVSLVSKRFLDIDSKTRKHVTVHVHFAPDPKRLSSRFPNIESLALKSYSHGLYRVHKCSIPVSPWIQEIAVKFAFLKSLSIRHMLVSPADLKLLANTRGPSLISLEIVRCQLFSEEGLEDVSSCCTKLTSLRLHENFVHDDYVRGCRPNGKWLHLLALHNSVIESLHFNDPFQIYDNKDVALLLANSLVSLIACPSSLIGFKQVFKDAKKLDYFGIGFIDEDEDYSGFEFPPNIRGLRFINLPQPSFPFLRPYLNQIRELVLAHDDDGDSNGTYCCVSKGCPNLDYLDVDLLDISNAALECVGSYLKNLKGFRILSREDGSIRDSWLDNGVRHMLRGCRKLERLDFQLCFDGLTDVGLGYVGMYGHNLRYLSLRRTGESDGGLLELAKGCPKLRKLILNDCPFSKQAVATRLFNINQSLRYVTHDDLVIPRPMVSAEGDKTKGKEQGRKRQPLKPTKMAKSLMRRCQIQ